MTIPAITVPSELRPSRVVFEHRFGPYAGLRQIVGTTDDFGGKPAPACSEPFNARPDNRLAVAGLVSAQPGYVLYRELDTDRKTYDPRQV